MGRDQRRSKRFPVQLTVRFVSADDFVVQYAENLSVGGLFVRDADHLAPLTELMVDLELPGSGNYQLRTRVAHILTPDRARAVGASPGAGLEIVAAPAGFEEKLLGYLSRLGERRGHEVLAAEDEVARAVARAGYRAEAVSPRQAAAACDRGRPVLAVVAPSRELGTYRAALGRDRAGLLLDHPDGAELDALIARLDRRAGL